MKEFWNERYADADYVYAKHLTNILKRKLMKCKPVKFCYPLKVKEEMLCTWQAWSGKFLRLILVKKENALKLANTENVTINYKVGDLPELDYKEEQFDVIALIFVHFSEEKKKITLRSLKILKLLVKNK